MQYIQPWPLAPQSIAAGHCSLPAQPSFLGFPPSTHRLMSCGKILTRSLPGGFGVEDRERIVAVKGGLQECHWNGSCQGSQAFSKGRTLSGNKQVHLEVLPLACWPHALVGQAPSAGCLRPLLFDDSIGHPWALGSAGLHARLSPPSFAGHYPMLCNGLTTSNPVINWLRWYNMLCSFVLISQHVWE